MSSARQGDRAFPLLNRSVRGIHKEVIEPFLQRKTNIPLDTIEVIHIQAPLGGLINHKEGFLPCLLQSLRNRFKLQSPPSA